MDDKQKLPEDIKPSWYKPIRRAQSIASENKGLGIIRFSVLIDENGDAISWSVPKLEKIEPRKIDQNSILDLLDNLTRNN